MTAGGALSDEYRSRSGLVAAGSALMVGFAGARDLDDRRRRRLVQEAESAERRAPVKPAAPVVASAPKFAASPIESVVRPQAWVNALLVVLGLSVSGGAVFLGEWTASNYPAAHSSFGPHGLLLRAMAAVYFLFAAQLAASIQWYRTRSRKDFNARYRVWHFVVPALLAFGLCAATDAHRVLADWAQGRWQIEGAHAATLLWMIPAGTVLLAMVRLLQTEMRGTGGAAPSLWIAILAAVVHAAVLLNAPVPVDEATLAIVGRSVALVWPLGLLLSLLFYARRVIYVTNEPCSLPVTAKPANEDAARSWLTWWRPRQDSDRQLRTRESKTAADRSTAQKAAAAKPQADSADDRPIEKPAMQTTAATRPQSPAAAPVAARTPAPAPTPPPAARGASQSAATPTSGNVIRRVDPVHDEEDDEEEGHGGRFHAMSKKERKKLRKMQQRERRDEED